MAAYVIVDITVHDAVTYEKYKELAEPTIAQHGGRYLVRGGKTEILEGSWQPNRFVILEFPTAEQAKGWWASSEYAEPKAIRQRTATTQMVLVEGLPGVPA